MEMSIDGSCTCSYVELAFIIYSFAICLHILDRGKQYQAKIGSERTKPATDDPFGCHAPSSYRLTTKRTECEGTH